MKHLWMIMAMILVCSLLLVGCNNTENPEPPETTAEQKTEAPEQTTVEQTTPEQTTAEETTPEETTEKQVVVHPTHEQIKEVASVVLEMDDILAAANNEQQDRSDFAGLTVHEDGTFTALFQMGTNDIWDPYFYLIKQDTVVDNILVIQYRSAIDQTLSMYAGSEGYSATGAGDHISEEMFATEGDEWGYLILDLTDVAACYDADASSLGYMRFGLSMAESGDSIQFGFVAFFHSMDDVNEHIPY